MVATLNHQACLFMGEDIGDSTGIRCDHKQTRSKTFSNRSRHVVKIARIQVDVCGIVQIGISSNGTRPMNLVCRRPKSLASCSSSGTHRAISRDSQTRFRVTTLYARKRAQYAPDVVERFKQTATHKYGAQRGAIAKPKASQFDNVKDSSRLAIRIAREDIYQIV